MIKVSCQWSDMVYILATWNCNATVADCNSQAPDKIERSKRCSFPVQALPIFLDRLADPITAVLISITVVLIFGKLII